MRMSIHISTCMLECGCVCVYIYTQYMDTHICLRLSPHLPSTYCHMCDYTHGFTFVIASAQHEA